MAEFLISAFKKNILVIIANGRTTNRSLKAYRAISRVSKDFCNSRINEMNVFVPGSSLTHSV